MNRLVVWLLVGSGVWRADGRDDLAPALPYPQAIGGPFFGSGILAAHGSEGAPNAAHNGNSDTLLFIWWNLHNLFDTVANSGPRDRDFLPQGPYRWDAKRYFGKLYAVGRGLAAAAGGRLPDAVGVCEVENAVVLDDLGRRMPPAWRLWRLHRDSPDGRGIDVALWYNPEKLRVDSVAWIHPEIGHPTREAIWVRWKKIDGTTITWIWTHLPSQRAPAPNARADAMRSILARATADAITGDLNEGFHGPLGQYLKQCGFTAHPPQNYPGTFAYRGRLEAIDGVWTAANAPFDALVQAVAFGLRWDKSHGYQIKGTYEGLRYLGGASDHLPLRIMVVAK